MGTVTTHDPRHLDGEPHEVAIQAGKDLIAALNLSMTAAEGFEWAARGAWLTAEAYRNEGDMPMGEAFYQTSQGSRILDVGDKLRALIKEAETLKIAAGWNPRQFP